MKKRIFTLFLASLFVAMGFSQTPTAVFKKASVDPVIDAEVDAVWAEAEAEHNIDLPFQSEVPTLGASGETTWQGLWTDNGVYVLLRVTDDAFYPNYAVDPPGNNWEYDKPEIYFDVNFDLQDGVGPGTANSGHHQIAPGFTDGQNDGTAITQDNGVVYAFLVSGSNYTAEYFIPFSILVDKNGVGLDKMADIGFDVTIIDRDPGDEARKRAVWANTGAINESYSNMDDCGIITLDGATANTYIDNITLSGGTEITQDNGTLQITATITPEDATNKVLIWSVENGTGMAMIDQDGLLTAIADGEVTVVATSTDGSYEDASLTVTISGQVTEMWEVNVIRNGTFAMVEANGQATYWGGWGGDAGSPLPLIVDGIAVCTPVATENTWQYQYNQQNLTAEPNIEYTFAFKAWADETRTFNVDFEDTPGNNYNRYGATTDPRSADGRSDWTFDVTAEPTWYVFDVTFDQMVETTVQKVQFMLGLSSVVTYIDSVLLVTTEQYNAGGGTSVPTNAASNVKIYPNPATDVLNVFVPNGNAKITIFDSVGRQVEELYEPGPKATINVSTYAKGVYFIRVNNEPVMKFIK
jgi:hypothetical protein